MLAIGAVMPTKQLATRVDAEQEKKFRETTYRLGTTPADALRMFIATFNECRGFPYDVRIMTKTEAEPFDNEDDAVDFATRISKRTINAAR
jgi:DNA-damage-inducible protein J